MLVKLHFWLLCCGCSVTKLCLTLCNSMNCSMPGPPVLHYLLEFAQTHVHWVSDSIQPPYPLLPPSLYLSFTLLYFPCSQSLPASGYFPVSQLFASGDQKYWSLSLIISPSNEYSGLISLKMDWLDLLPVQGTIKSLLQHHSSKALILWGSAFFMVQLSHPYMTIGKTIALTR